MILRLSEYYSWKIWTQWFIWKFQFNTLTLLKEWHVFLFIGFTVNRLSTELKKLKHRDWKMLFLKRIYTWISIVFWRHFFSSSYLSLERILSIFSLDLTESRPWTVSNVSWELVGSLEVPCQFSPGRFLILFRVIRSRFVLLLSRIPQKQHTKFFNPRR